MHFPMRATPITLAPMRLLRAWLFRERALRGPAAIELDVVEHQINRETAAVAAASVEAGVIEAGLARVRCSVHAALTDAKTPGVIDSSEARGIARQLIRSTIKAQHHSNHLKTLQ